MGIFLVQGSSTDKTMSDHCTELIRSCEQQNWYNMNGEERHKVYVESNARVYSLTDNTELELNSLIKDIIPIGSIEYVESYMSNKKIQPINIPVELRKNEFIQRQILCNTSLKDAIDHFKDSDPILFIKSDERCKTDITGTYTIQELSRMADNEHLISKEKLLVSSLIDIRSEWRAFVFNKRILDVRQYSGSWRDRPDTDFIDRAVEEYRNCPPAYTLDIGLISDGGMAVIEAHNFIACGLYGFSDARFYPQMCLSAYKYELKNNWRS